MAEVKVHSLPFSADELVQRLNQVESNTTVLTEQVNNLAANTTADAQFKNEVAETYATKSELENYQSTINALEERVVVLENKKDNDTVYDDDEVRSLIAALTERVVAVEDDRIDAYDDTEVRALITALTSRVADVENRTDNDHIYDDTEVRLLIESLSARLTTMEESSDADTVYDDSEVRSLIDSIVARVAAVENNPYNDTEVRALIDALTERVATIEESSDADTVYNDEEVRSLIAALTSRVDEVEAREDKDTLYDDTEVRALIDALNEKVTELEESSDADTVYDDTTVRNLIEALGERVKSLEESSDADTVYDDTEVRSLIDALTERMIAVEESSDADTVYNDEEVRSLINDLALRMTAEEQKVDNDTVYDDEEVRSLIDALTARISAVEESSDADTVYDDTEVRALIAALTERMTAEENKEDHDTVYDDTDIQSKYATLSTKYNTLFNYVYSQATGEAATPLNADYVANTLNNDTTVTVTEGELGDVTIPEATKTMTINAPMQDNATVTLTSPKSINLNNTSENPVAVTIEAPAGTSIPTMNVSGNFTTLEVNNGSITGKNDATVSNVIINNDIDKNASVTGVVYNDNATITTDNLPKLGLANNNNSENVIPSATINAENTTVTLNKSQWNELTSNVSDETLIVTQHAHINKLIVGKGNVVVYDNDMTNRIDEIVNDTEYTVDLNRNTATTAAEVATFLTGNPGIVTLADDFTRSRIAGGILWSGNYTLDLAGHTLDLTNTNYAIMGRNTVNITIVDSVGGGKIINNSGYGLWAGDNSVFTIDVPETTEISAVTHTLYCEGSKRPHINVKGGTYKMTVGSDDVNPYDANGNYRYMFNHLDATYTREGNCFTVTGGTFYGFDPAHVTADPGEEYSMIDLNEYESQMIGEENGIKIYKVVKKQ